MNHREALQAAHGPVNEGLKGISSGRFGIGVEQVEWIVRAYLTARAEGTLCKRMECQVNHRVSVESLLRDFGVSDER